MKPSSLGDVVHALPTLSALRGRFPNAHITWFVKEEWAPLLERAEGLDQVWAVGSGVQQWLSQVPSLRAARFDLAVDLQGLLRSASIAWLSGCRTRVGFANSREGSRWLYTQRVSVPTSDMHAVDRYLLLASALGAATKGKANFCLKPSSADAGRVEDLFKKHGLSAQIPWIAMAASARWPTKRWSAESFAATADEIQEQGMGRVGLIGSADDCAIAEQVKGFMKTEPVDLVGATDVGLLPALIRSARALVTNDSGPLHVAVAVGTPVVTIFGATSPRRTGPYGDGHRVLAGQVPCSPCFSRTCRNEAQMECLGAIAPSQVAQAVRERLMAYSIQGAPC